jgi:uncharacterized membrane protein
MTFNIESLAHMQDFDLPTESLGVIRCGPLDANKKFVEYREAIQDSTVICVDLARDLLLSSARKLTGDKESDAYCRGPSLTGAEVAELSQEELDTFCNTFWTKRLGIAVEDRPAEGAHNSGKKGCEVIALALRDYVESERATLQKSVERTKKSIDGYLHKSPMEFSEARIFMPPPSPIHQTNASLGKLVANSEQIAAEAKSDQAEAKALATQGIAATNKGIYVAIGIAVVGLFFSIFTWIAGRENAKKADVATAARQSKIDAQAIKLQETLGAIVSTAKEDRKAFAKDLEKTRALIGAGPSEVKSNPRVEAGSK